MKTFKIKIEPEVIQDIQAGIDWYNEQQSRVGRKFHSEVKASIAKLKLNSFFQIRYDDVRCLPLKKFPFMIHFSVDENIKLIVVRAVLNTSRDPNMWKSRSQRQKQAHNKT